MIFGPFSKIGKEYKKKDQVVRETYSNNQNKQSERYRRAIERFEWVIAVV